MKFKIETDGLEKTVDWTESKLLIQEFREELTENGVSVELTLINDDGEEFWKSPFLMTRDSPTEVRPYIKQSFDNNGVSAKERDAWLSEFDLEIEQLQAKLVQVEQVEPPSEAPIIEPINQPQNAHEESGAKAVSDDVSKEDETAPIDDDWAKIEEPKQKKKKAKKVKKAKEVEQVEVVEALPNVAKQSAQTGQAVVRVIATWKVAVLVLVVTLVYFTALTLIFQYLNVKNEFALVGIPLASSAVLIWYIGTLISSAKRKVLEEGITKEVKVYVAQEQLKEKHLLEKRLQNLNNLYGTSEQDRLANGEAFDNAMRLAEEVTEMSD